MEMTPQTFEAKDRFDIQVALKIIRHIRSGIYRDKAGALRELISNSFDAQATEVTIDTGYPTHETIVVEDNGLGLDAAVLRQAFTQVGLSLTKTNPERYTSDLHRKVIGRFGIGFLAAAHISKDIWIKSFLKGTSQGLEAHIDLAPYFLYMDQIETFDEFKFGTVSYREFTAPKGAAGTRIELRGVRTGNFHRVLTHEGEEFLKSKWPTPGSREKKPGGLMKELVEKSQRRTNLLYLDRLQGREEILWHLGMTAPVRYLDGGPVRMGYLEGEAEEVIRRLRKYNENLKFQLWMDGVEVRKPILLPTHRIGGEESEASDLPTDVLISPVKIAGKTDRGGTVQAEGYLFYQPWRIVPAELRGLYPRMVGVGIGSTYENRFLSELKGESPILRVQVSGELYVLQGLDEALNLDRSGFMELDPEYAFLAKEAGDQVREFFRRAKSGHGRRAAGVKARKAERVLQDSIRSLRSYVKRLGIRAKVIIEPAGVQSEISPDYSKVSLYQIGPDAELLFNRVAQQIIFSTTESAEIQIGKMALVVDSILGNFATDPPAARREFARLLEELVKEDDA
jgi:hypothetical protein